MVYDAHTFDLTGTVDTSNYGVSGLLSDDYGSDQGVVLGDPEAEVSDAGQPVPAARRLMGVPPSAASVCFAVMSDPSVLRFSASVAVDPENPLLVVLTIVSGHPPYSVLWEDGGDPEDQMFNGADHTYPEDGEKTITVTGADGVGEVTTTITLTSP